MNKNHDTRRTHLSERLVIRTQLGDRSALPELVLEWHPSLTGFLRNTTSDPDRVDDLAQEVWMRVIQGLPKPREPAHFPAWMFTIARRVRTDQLRKRYRQPTPLPISDDAAATSPLEPIADELDLERAMKLLHPADREAVFLHYFQGFSVAETGAIAGVADGTIKSRLYRARQELKNELPGRDQ